MALFHNRALRKAYYEGVLDFLGSDSPWLCAYGGPGTNPRKCREMDIVRRQGFFDAQDRNVMRPFDFDAQTVFQRVEIREAAQRAAGEAVEVCHA